MSSFYQLLIANLKIYLRDRQGFFWILALPVAIYVVVSILPVGKYLTPGRDYPDFVLPGMIAMTVMQTGVYNLAYWMIDLRARGAIKRLIAAPIRPADLVLSIVASRLVIIMLEVVILSAIGLFFFGVHFAGNALSALAILVISILGGSIFLLVGLLISSIANSYQAAAPLSSGIGLPLTFLGNIFYPLDVLPPVLQNLAKILPITYFADGLRQAYLYPLNLRIIGFDILVLAIWLALMLVFTISVFKLKE